MKTIRCDICMLVEHANLEHDARVMKEASSLAKAGWDVLVVCFNNGTKPTLEDKNGFRIWRVTLSVPKASPGKPKGSLPSSEDRAAQLYERLTRWFPPLKQPYWLFFSIMRRRWKKKLLQALPHIEAKVFHAHDYGALLSFNQAGIKKPIVYDSHELFFDIHRGDSRYQQDKNGYERKIEKRLAQQAVRVITVSDQIAERLEQTLQVPRPIVVRNAVDIRIGDQATTFESDGRKMIVHSGSLSQFRGLLYLVEALQYFPDDVVLVLMGNGSLKSKIVDIAEALGCLDRILFVPPVPVHCVAATMAQAQVGVAMLEPIPTGQYEFALPNKFFEGIAAGLPMITSQNTAIAALMHQYDMGITCDPTDPRQIADAVIEILKPDNQARYRANVAKARQVLNWEHEEQKLISVYQEILPKVSM